ncbi:MAG: O-antigen ligase family protein, partial [Flavobacteriales bacterium]|nr:O-antigen ligase family protein [Flavobacteriales bacterium]
QDWLVPIICGVFVLANMFLMANRAYWLNLLPVALIIGWAMFATVDRLLVFIAFATPLSINLEELDLGGIGVSIPTEPIMVALTGLFLIKLGLERGVVDRRVWRHPITAVILAQLAWMLLCTLTSSMPMVSAKYVLARTWFVVCMYFMVSRLFEDRRNVHRFIWAYIGGLSIVVGYTLIHHAQYGFAHDPAHWVMTPFFKDHTSYGAILAFFLPFSLSAISFPGYSRSGRVVAFLLFALLAVGLVFSYTRAAWLSLVGSLGLYVIMRFRVPTWLLVVLVLGVGAVYVVEKEQITIALERNRDESSDDLGKHVKSISNISSDASNLERINRWNSAFRMFMERPVLGWGPGTYMFQYAPFQAAADRTIISTNFGVGGNAHSEYLGPLSEQGLPGMLLMLALVAMTLLRAMALYRRMPPGADRRLVVAAILGLVTYYLHGALNNFLDLDKASVPFWAFTALIVLMDLKYPAAGEGSGEGRAGVA